MKAWITVDYELLNKLKVKYQRTDVFLTNQITVYCNDLYLKGINSLSILEYENNNELNNDEKTLCMYAKMAYLYIIQISNTRCSHTNAFVSFILKRLGLSLHPSITFSKSRFSLHIGEKHQIEVCPTYVISRDDALLLVDDDKQLEVGFAYALGEYKIGLNMVVVAYNFYKKMDENNRKNKDNQTVYSIRVIGTKFTFYKVTIPFSYLDSLDNGFPSEDIIIYQFPDKDKMYDRYEGPSFPFFDYLDVKDRYMITDTLLQLTSLFN